MKIALFNLMVFLIAMPITVSALDSDQKAIWALEEAYWDQLKTGDLEAWNAQWHESYVGWPHDSSQPVHRDDVIKLNAQVLATLKTGTLDYRLLLQEVVVIGDVAVVHYLFSWSATGQNGDEIHRAGKVTHTWYRENGHWKILSGMSAPPVSDVD